MSALRPLISLALVLCVFVMQSLAAAASFSPMAVKDQVTQFGPGSKVKLKLSTGQKLSASIQDVQDDGFLIVTKPGESPRRIAYGDVRQLKLSSLRYTERDQPDPLAARRVIVGLGVGHHVVVNPRGAKAIHGNIQSIDSDSFTVLPDRATSPVRIAYTDIRRVEKNLSLGATIVLVVLILAAVLVTTTVIATR